MIHFDLSNCDLEPMEKHQGRIWVESDAETGTTFYLLFKREPTGVMPV